ARLPGNAGGNSDVLRESAIAVYADDFNVATDVSLAGAALVALAAGNMCLRGDKITRSQRGDFTPNLYDLTRKFMSKDARDLHTAAGPGIPLIDMDIRATDGGGSHLHQDIAWANVRNIDKGNRRSRHRLGFEGRLHFTDHFSKILHDGVLLYAFIMRLHMGDCKRVLIHAGLYTTLICLSCGFTLRKVGGKAERECEKTLEFTRNAILLRQAREYAPPDLYQRSSSD